VISSSQSDPFSSRWRLRLRGQDLGLFQLNVPGRHNVLNAPQPWPCSGIGCGLDAIRSGLAAFSGVERRFQLRGREREVTVVDDYGHHPTEILATLSTPGNADSGASWCCSSRTVTRAPST